MAVGRMNLALQVSGMWLHVVRAAHRVRNYTLPLLVPATCRIDDPDNNQHDGYLDQHADNRGEGGAGLEAEQGNGRGHGKFKEITCTDECRGCGNAVW